MSLRPIVRSLIRQPLRLPTERRGGWSPLALFAAGEQGGWWDPSDFSTMFQDSAGTTPVTAVGQPVGLIRDKSGRGNHLTQGTAASRPTLQQDASGFLHLSFDGVDDGLVTAANADFSATDKVTVFAGVQKTTDVSSGEIVELSASASTNAGAFGLQAPNVAGTGTYAWFSGGVTLAGVGSAASYPAPITNVLTGIGDISSDICTLRVNAAASSSPTDQGAGNYGSYPLYVGRRGGTQRPLSGRIYQLIARGTASSAAQIALAERFVGSKMGIVL